MTAVALLHIRLNPSVSYRAHVAPNRFRITHNLRHFNFYSIQPLRSSRVQWVILISVFPTHSCIVPGERARVIPEDDVIRSAELYNRIIVSLGIRVLLQFRDRNGSSSFFPLRKRYSISIVNYCGRGNGARTSTCVIVTARYLFHPRSFDTPTFWW